MSHHLPCLADVDHVDTVWASLPQIRLHVNLQVLGAQMTLRCEQHLHILGGGIECRGEVIRRHVASLDISAVSRYNEGLVFGR